MKRQDAEERNPAPVREPNKKSDEIRQQERVPQNYPPSGKRSTEGQSASAGGNRSGNESRGNND